MARYKCASCGHEEETEVHEPPKECPFCNASMDDVEYLWEELE